MIQQTLARLEDVSGPCDVWVITNSLLEATIKDQLPELKAEHVLCEPAARNTAPACALAAFLLERDEPNVVIGIFPSDHVVKDVHRFTQIIRAGVNLAASGERIVVLGVPPTRAETGFGYIEQGARVDPDTVPCGAVPVCRVRRFTEKPDAPRAEGFLRAGNYVWNSGIFLWTARTLANAIREHRPAIALLLEQIAAARGTPAFAEVFTDLYPSCENVSIDYAVLEPRSRKGEAESEIYCLPADFQWNDLGSWAALYEHSCQVSGTLNESNVIDSVANVTIDSEGSYVYAPGRTVALLGVQNLVVVVTDDAILITTRERSQDVTRVTKALADAKREDCL